MAAKHPDPDDYLLRHASPSVKKLHRQARSERRSKARKQWWLDAQTQNPPTQ
jgi:hypothetical protein